MLTNAYPAANSTYAMVSGIADGAYYSAVQGGALIAQAKEAVSSLGQLYGYQGSASEGSFQNTYDALAQKGGPFKVNGIDITLPQLLECFQSTKIWVDQALQSDSQFSLAAYLNAKSGNSPVPSSRIAHSLLAGRIVTTNVDYIMNENHFSPCNPKRCIALAASVPMLGSIHRGYFTNNHNHAFLPDFYVQEMMSRVELILKAAAESGGTDLVIPAFGVGDFAGGFDATVSPLVAQCFKAHLQSGQWNFQSVVFSMPADDQFQYYNAAFASYTGQAEVVVTKNEMTAVAIELSDNGRTPVVVIPNHPTRRPGNGWAMNSDGTGVNAQEETLSKHLLAYVAAQSASANPRYVGGQNTVMQPVALAHRSFFATLGTSDSIFTKTYVAQSNFFADEKKKHDFMETMQFVLGAIQCRYNVIYQPPEKKNVELEITFKDPMEAMNFASFLWVNGIGFEPKDAMKNAALKNGQFSLTFTKPQAKRLAQCLTLMKQVFLSDLAGRHVPRPKFKPS